MTTYLEQFARNRRRKDKTEVLTARLPESLYYDFKGYCTELGLSISEAVCLLVEREMSEKVSVSEELATSDEYKMNDDVVEMDTEVVKVVARRNSNSNTNRFITTQWQVNGQLPCPYCGRWLVSTNFSRHAKLHSTTTLEIFTNEKYREKITSMIKAKQEELN
ncbi:hypothetical protein QUF94_28120 [Peribacillus sp. NJ4]|uniref:hypothetical protein n=1 Tax=unclassified Peribacillus TaxID=2675266 RepID=UPI0025A0DE1A|nr:MULTISPECIES: hypothetical protein [unclassified Peribacillus]MDM5215175.1 hypothetical protein [Peribacillus sp. NJ4]MDM5224461.1 hypothetical protein [Peribacillus sp. NJ11]